MDWTDLTWQGTEKRLLSGMATHVGLEGIAARMVHVQAWASFPFTDVFLLPGSDVVIVDMLHQHVHVPQIANGAVGPFAHGDLLMSDRIVVLHLRELLCRRGPRHISRRIRRDVTGIFSGVVVGQRRRLMRENPSALPLCWRHQKRIRMVWESVQTGISFFGLHIIGEFTGGMGRERGSRCRVRHGRDVCD